MLVWMRWIKLLVFVTWFLKLVRFCVLRCIYDVFMMYFVCYDVMMCFYGTAYVCYDVDMGLFEIQIVDKNCNMHFQLEFITPI